MSSAQINIAVLRGVLAADAHLTELADGRTVHNFEVRADGAAVPIAWYDAKRPPRLLAGQDVVVAGRVRRRWFRAGGGSQSRTEVVAQRVVKGGSARADRVVEAALDAARGTGSEPG
ncbi:MAG: hypothetical protein R8F63_09240 [Acidimicrobiales bacterium]|nr:hypothetical protein [Acidimicrobiales bacterium]